MVLREEFAGLPRLPTDVGETQEVERPRVPFSTLFSVCDCKAPDIIALTRQADTLCCARLQVLRGKDLGKKSKPQNES